MHVLFSILDGARKDLHTHICVHTQERARAAHTQQAYGHCCTYGHARELVATYELVAKLLTNW